MITTYRICVLFEIFCFDLSNKLLQSRRRPRFLSRGYKRRAWTPRIFVQSEQPAREFRSSLQNAMPLNVSMASDRSMYDMAELRSLVQKMVRDPSLLEGGWPEFFYFVDEYMRTMQRTPVLVALFAAKDCASCPLLVLQEVTRLVEAGSRAGRLEYWQCLMDLAEQPVDRSAAYLSVACLAQPTPLSVLSTDPNEIFWREYIPVAAADFGKAMSHAKNVFEETPTTYPISSDDVLKLATSLVPVFEWYERHPKTTLKNANAQRITNELLKAKPRSSTVRAPVLAFSLILEWTRRADDGVEPLAVSLVNAYRDLLVACCWSADTAIHLILNNALLVFAGRLPDRNWTQSDPNVHEESVPHQARAYSMPAFAQDKHTHRGRHCVNTEFKLRELCAKRGREFPENPESSHGPSAHMFPQDFIKFMAFVSKCEREDRFRVGTTTSLQVRGPPTVPGATDREREKEVPNPSRKDGDGPPDAKEKAGGRRATCQEKLLRRYPVAPWPFRSVPSPTDRAPVNLPWCSIATAIEFTRVRAQSFASCKGQWH